MKTDSLAYRILKDLPEVFFETIGRPASDARRYRFDAVEIKDTSVRLDGFYSPVPPDDFEPIYFVEHQNYVSENTYADLILKLGLFLDNVNPRQDWKLGV